MALKFIEQLWNGKKPGRERPIVARPAPRSRTLTTLEGPGEGGALGSLFSSWLNTGSSTVKTLKDVAVGGAVAGATVFGIPAAVDGLQTVAGDVGDLLSGGGGTNPDGTPSEGVLESLGDKIKNSQAGQFWSNVGGDVYQVVKTGAGGVGAGASDVGSVFTNIFKGGAGLASSFLAKLTPGKTIASPTVPAVAGPAKTAGTGASVLGGGAAGGATLASYSKTTAVGGAPGGSLLSSPYAVAGLLSLVGGGIGYAAFRGKGKGKKKKGIPPMGAALAAAAIAGGGYLAYDEMKAGSAPAGAGKTGGKGGGKGGGKKSTVTA